MLIMTLRVVIVMVKAHLIIDNNILLQNDQLETFISSRSHIKIVNSSPKSKKWSNSVAPKAPNQ